MTEKDCTVDYKSAMIRTQGLIMEIVKNITAFDKEVKGKPLNHRAVHYLENQIQLLAILAHLSKSENADSVVNLVNNPEMAFRKRI